MKVVHAPMEVGPGHGAQAKVEPLLSRALERIDGQEIQTIGDDGRKNHVYQPGQGESSRVLSGAPGCQSHVESSFHFFVDLRSCAGTPGRRKGNRGRQRYASCPTTFWSPRFLRRVVRRGGVLRAGTAGA